MTPVEYLSRNWSYFVLAAGALVLFGLAYNRMIAYLEQRSHAEGLTAFAVAFGVAITVLAAAPFIGLQNALIVLAAFVCSGLPMIAGSLLRFWKMQQRLHAINREIRHGQTTSHR